MENKTAVFLCENSNTSFLDVFQPIPGTNIDGENALFSSLLSLLHGIIGFLRAQRCLRLNQYQTSTASRGMRSNSSLVNFIFTF